MRLCFIADGRSPIARNWIRSFIERDHDVHVISLYPFDPAAIRGASLHVVPVGLSALARSPHEKRPPAPSMAAIPRQKTAGPIARFKQAAAASYGQWYNGWLGPLDVRRSAVQVRRLLPSIGPDIVHALRIPCEGMLAAEAMLGVPIPLLVSVWGNDFTLWARHFPLNALMTRRTMKRADALHTDCLRDLRLARQFGFSAAKPAVVLPGGGGIRTDLFRPLPPSFDFIQRWRIPEGAPLVINPRGYRSYVRSDTFFRAIPRVLLLRPDVLFLAIGMEGNPQAQRWVRKLKIEHAVRLLPSVSQHEMAHFFRRAEIAVSPSEHDGTPNTLLEAMASGACPVAGDIESVREWIDHGVNGLLCDPASPDELARSILRALQEPDLRQRAASANQRLVADRAEHQSVIAAAQQFYSDVIRQAPVGRDPVQSWRRGGSTPFERPAPIGSHRGRL